MSFGDFVTGPMPDSNSIYELDKLRHRLFDMTEHRNRWREWAHSVAHHLASLHSDWSNIMSTAPVCKLEWEE